MSDEVKRARQKYAAALRAQFALKQKMAKIDFETDVIGPALKDFDAEAAHGVIPSIEVNV